MTDSFPEQLVPQGTGQEREFSEPTAEWRKDFDGLLLIGSLRSKFEYLHHVIRIRTLNSFDLLIAAHLSAEWAANIGRERAHATAIACLAIEFIDGQPLPSPLGESDDNIEWARQRFRWTQRLYPFTVDRIYDEYIILGARVVQILEDMGKGSGQGDATPGLREPSEPLAGEVS